VQLVQLAAPLLKEYLPCEHIAHTAAPASEELPAGHWEQFEDWALPANVPETQSAQLVDPVDEANVPAEHAAQTPVPVAEKVPSTHGIEVTHTFAPAAEISPDEQLEHDDDDVAPTTDE